MSRGGRGGKRGRGKPFGGNLEALGLSRGEMAPPPILQPPPLFPGLDRRPLDLKSSEVQNYLVTVKQDLRQCMAQGPFYLRVSSESVKIAKYSDRYKTKNKKERHKVDWKYFPAELKPRQKSKRDCTSSEDPKMAAKKRKRTRNSSGDLEPSSKRSHQDDSHDKSKSKKSHQVTQSDSSSSRSGKSPAVESDEEMGSPPKSKKKKRPRLQVTFESAKDEEGLEKRLEQLEKKEQLLGEGEEQSAEEESSEEVVDEEEEDEEGTDYNLTYFDNGEDYDIGEDDALEEGPIY